MLRQSRVDVLKFSFQKSIVQNQRRSCYTTTNRTLVYLSELTKPEKNGRRFLTIGLVGAASIITARLYYSSQYNEHNRAILLDSNFTRSGIDLFLTGPSTLVSTSTLTSKLKSSDNNLSTSERVAFHCLLLQTIAKHKKGSLTKQESDQVIETVIPLIHNNDPAIRSKISELLLLYIDAGLVNVSGEEGEKILHALAELTVLPNPESISSGSFSPDVNTSVSSAISKLLQQNASLANKLFDTYGMKLVSVLSESRKGDKLFFVPFCSIVASAVHETGKAEEMVAEGLMPFLFNAVSLQTPEKMKILSEVSGSKLARFKSDDLETIQAKQFTYREVARCIANIPHSTPSLGPVVIELGALDILQRILDFGRSAQTIQSVARAVANLSTNEHNRQAIIDAGWVGVLQHWISAECQRSVTSKGKMSATELLTKQTLLKESESALHEIEKEQISRKLTTIALVGLGNLVATEPRVADNVARTQLLREVMDNLSRNDGNLMVRQQFARLISHMANHVDGSVNKRIQTLVGLDGMSVIIQGSNDPSIYFHVARTLAALVLDRPFAKLVESQDPLGWELVEDLMALPLLPVQRQVARVIANLATVIGGKNLLKKEGLQEKLEFWSKAEDPILSDNALRALASLMGSKASNAKYAEGVHLLHPPLGSDEFKEDTAQFDIILIHGVGGDPLGTWRSGEDASVIWPRDWLTKDFPDVRVISLEYEMPISKWNGEALPLHDQALIALKKLKLANVGERPIIFITHSFGGLMAKQILQFSSKDKRFSRVLDETRGIVFFSTPHRGADIASYADKVFFRKTTALDTLYPNSVQLTLLNKDFQQFAPTVATLSFGENDNTCVGSKYTCFQLVSDESANPNFHTKAEHKFIKLNANHWETCKPHSKDSIAYQELRKFINVLWKEEFYSK